MKRILLASVLPLALTGCSLFDKSGPDVAPPDGMVTPMARPLAGAPPAGAVTAEQFDTTTAEERAAATATPVASEANLGTTIATLGDPANPGFWLETPLTDTVRPGRVVAKATGESVQVELRPIAGPEGAGSRISLPALRLLDLGLTGLHELTVYGL